MSLSKLDLILTDFQNDDNMHEDLYHYTDSYSKLIKILQGRCLLMTDYKKLKYEIYYALKYLQERIPDFNLKVKMKVNCNRIIPETFWGAFNWYREQLRVFISSFSMKRDDDKLWHAFGGKGEGFAIGISKRHFQYKPSFPPNVRMKIYYGEEKLELFYNAISNVINYLKNIEDEDEYRRVLVELFLMIIPELPRFLTQRFIKQCEYRLYSMDLVIEGTNNLSGRIPEQLIFPVEEISRIYCEKISPDNFVEIIIGNKNDFSKCKSQIKSDLKNFFTTEELVNIQIVYSNVKNSVPINST